MKALAAMVKNCRTNLEREAYFIFAPEIKRLNPAARKLERFGRFSFK